MKPFFKVMRTWKEAVWGKAAIDEAKVCVWVGGCGVGWAGRSNVVDGELGVELVGTAAVLASETGRTDIGCFAE